MKVIMGIAQATFGIIWIGIVGLLTAIGIAHLSIKGVVDYVKSIKNKKRGKRNE